MKQHKVNVETNINIKCSFDKAIEYCKEFNLKPEKRKGVATIDGSSKDSVYTFVSMKLVEDIAEVNLYVAWSDEDKWQEYWSNYYGFDKVK